MIRHVVMWKFKTDDPAEQADLVTRIRDDIRALGKIIPQLHAVQVGGNVFNVENNWDLVLISDFKDLADMEIYMSHPAHQKVVAYIRSVTSDRRAVDFEVK